MMRFAVATLWFAVTFVLGCPKTYPPPPMPTLPDGAAIDRPALACARLRQLECASGMRDNCERVVRHMLATRIGDLDEAMLDCIAKAESPTAVRMCGQPCR